MKPTLGRIVHYVLGKRSNGLPVVRPAIVVGMDDAAQTIHVQVFTNGDEDDEVLEGHERSTRDARGRARSVVHRKHARQAEADDQGFVRLATDRWFWPPGAAVWPAGSPGAKP